MANFHSQQNTASKYRMQTSFCEWREPGAVWCYIKDCSRCGWHPDVEERRKERVREQWSQTVETWSIGRGSIDKKKS